MYETLLSEEEANKCEELDQFYRIPLDDRDLNYSLYYESGSKQVKQKSEYSSLNTNILTVDDLTNLFKKRYSLKSYLNYDA